MRTNRFRVPRSLWHFFCRHAPRLCPENISNPEVLPPSSLSQRFFRSGATALMAVVFGGLSLPAPSALSASSSEDIQTACAPGVEVGTSAPTAHYPAGIRSQALPTQVTEFNEFAIPSQAGDSSAPLTRENETQARAVEAFLIAQIFEQNGDLERALEFYRRTLDLNPGLAGLASQVARVYLRKGNPAAALDILKNAAAARPDDEKIPLFISDIYWRVLKKTGLALDYAARAYRINPDNPLSFEVLYNLHLMAGQADKAAALLSSAERSSSKNPHFWLNLARIIARPPRGTGFSAPDIPASAIDRALRLVEKARALAGGDSSAHMAAGDLLAGLGRLEDAVNAYRTASETAPGEAQPRERMARALLELRRDGEAITPLEELVRIDPSRPGIFELLGELYFQKGDLEKAASAFDKSLEQRPTDPATYIRAARIMRELGRYDRSVQILDRSRTAFPHMAELDIELAISLSLAGRHVEALSAIEAAIGTAAEKGGIDLQTAHYLAGGIAYKAGEYDLAAQYYKKAIEADPANAAAPYNDLGYMWLELGKNIDEAGELIRRAVELEPDNGAFLDSMGWFLHKKGRHQEALSYLLKAEAAAPPEGEKDRDDFLATIRDHIGDVHHALGNIAEAIHFWKLAAESDPDNREIAAKIERETRRLTANPTPEPAPR